MATEDHYDRARQRFEDLEVEERARFLLEASVSTLAQGLEQAGRALSDSLDEVFHGADRASRSSGEAERPGAAEPETAERRAPRNGSTTSEP